jgi:hypothetical protein
LHHHHSASLHAGNQGSGELSGIVEVQSQSLTSNRRESRSSNKGKERAIEVDSASTIQQQPSYSETITSGFINNDFDANSGLYSDMNMMLYNQPFSESALSLGEVGGMGMDMEMANDSNFYSLDLQNEMRLMQDQEQLYFEDGFEYGEIEYSNQSNENTELGLGGQDEDDDDDDNNDNEGVPSGIRYELFLSTSM